MEDISKMENDGISKKRQELESMESEFAHLGGLKQGISEKKEQIKAEEKNIEKKNMEEIQKEKRELEKTAIFECQAYFKCPSCKKEVEINFGQEDLFDMSKKVLIETTCQNPKCEVSVKHESNDLFKHPILYAQLPLAPSKFKKVMRGYS